MFLPFSSLNLIYLHCSHHAKQAEDGWVGVKSLNGNKPHMHTGQHVQNSTTTLSVMLLCKIREITNELCCTKVSGVLSWFVVQALSDVPTESGKTFKALLLCKERFQEAECQDGSVFSLYLSLPAPVSSSVSFPLSLFLSPMWAEGAARERQHSDRSWYPLTGGGRLVQYSFSSTEGSRSQLYCGSGPVFREKPAQAERWRKNVIGSVLERNPQSLAWGPAGLTHMHTCKHTHQGRTADYAQCTVDGSGLCL